MIKIHESNQADLPKALGRILSGTPRELGSGSGVYAYMKNMGSLDVVVHVDTRNQKASVYTYDASTDREKESKLFSYTDKNGLRGLLNAYSRMTGLSISTSNLDEMIPSDPSKVTGADMARLDREMGQLLSKGYVESVLESIRMAMGDVTLVEALSTVRRNPDLFEKRPVIRPSISLYEAIVGDQPDFKAGDKVLYHQGNMMGRRASGTVIGVSHDRHNSTKLLYDVRWDDANEDSYGLPKSDLLPYSEDLIFESIAEYEVLNHHVMNKHGIVRTQATDECDCQCRKGEDVKDFWKYTHPSGKSWYQRKGELIVVPSRAR